MVTELTTDVADSNTKDNNSAPAPKGRAVIVRLSADLAADLDRQCIRDGRNASAQLRWLITRRALELAHNSAA